MLLRFDLTIWTLNKKVLAVTSLNLDNGANEFPLLYFSPSKSQNVENGKRGGNVLIPIIYHPQPLFPSFICFKKDIKKKKKKKKKEEEMRNKRTKQKKRTKQNKVLGNEKTEQKTKCKQKTK